MSRQPQEAPLAVLRAIAAAVPSLSPALGEAVETLDREFHELGLSYGKVKQRANMAELRIAYLERMLEIQDDQMRRMQWRLRDRDHVVPPMPEVPSA